MIRRREFITLLGGAATGWPLVARSQQPRKLPTIGFLGATAASAAIGVGAFLQRLHELGWIEGRTVAIEYHWADARTERFAEIANEFVGLNVDVIVTYGAPAAIAAKQATSVIPIVFTGVGDPVGNAIVASLSRPGGNVTGLSVQGTDLAGKRLELLRELLPDLRRLVIMANMDAAGAVLEMGEVQAMARAIGLEVVTLEIRRAEEIEPAFEALKRGDALYICTDVLLSSHRNRIAALAAGARLPTIYGVRQYVEAGGLISYGPNLPDLWRRAGDYVDKVLRGTKPGVIPVEQPTKFDLIINLTTAKALGIEVPPTLIARADEVIE
jgi:putative tryptophan/tyrosine transport system substrate-binding protein